MKNNLLAIDPGETVGWALFTIKSGEIVDADASQYEYMDFLKFLEKKINSYDEVLIEDYKIRKTTISANLNKELVTVKVIGVIEWLCKKYNTEYSFQPAGIGKEFFDKQRLKDFNLWVVGKKHARDAIRHGLWYLAFGKGVIDGTSQDT